MPVLAITCGQRKPRIFWACTHVPLRYDEVAAAIDAGFEIIPALGSMGYLPMEPRYDDENWSLYPEWKVHCTLPLSIVESIRRIRFDQDSRVQLSEQEIVLFNKHIDAIYVASSPTSICDISEWYSGLLIFRSFGRISSFSSYSERCELENIPLKKVASKENFLFLPIFSTLLELEKPWLTRRSLVLRGYVSSTRLPFKWLSRESGRYVAAVVKLVGWDANTSGSERLDKLKVATSRLPCRLIGKNPRDLGIDLPDNISVTGFLQHELFYEEIACARAFIYIGDDHYHMHFTPLEAVSIGVPVFFHKNCPMGQEVLRTVGDRSFDLKSIGGYDSYEEINTVLSSVIDDLKFLQDLANNQAKVLLEIFSRDSAVDGFRKIGALIGNSRYFSFDALDFVTDRNHPNRKPPTSVFPVALGQYMALDALSLPGPVGKICGGADWGVGNPVKVMSGEDVQGGFLGSMYFDGRSGIYELSMSFECCPSQGKALAYVEIGVFDPDFVSIAKMEVLSLGGGREFLKMLFELGADHVGKTNELRLFSLALGDLVFLGGSIKFIGLN